MDVAASLPRVAGTRFYVSARRAVARLYDVAPPAQCALCGNLSQSVVCRGCDESYWNEPRSRCRTCALPMPAFRREDDASARHCAACLDEPPWFNATLALADYRAPLDTLALDLKFRARLGTGNAFARHLQSRFEDSDLPMPDVIAPVPLSRKRLISRGYNQAWAIARPLAKRLGVKSDPMLARRTIHTAPQSKLDLDTRRRNLGNAFEVQKDVRGLHIGIIDDVMTSGATLDALARTLKQSGARRVTNFVALRTPKD
jgi:ComF family protein